jgi:hypothetical protein
MEAHKHKFKPIKSLSQFVKYIEEAKRKAEQAENNVDLLFRGQPCDEPLIPRLGRLQLRDVKDDLAKNEELIIEEFERASTLLTTEFQPQDKWDVVALAQHHGLPTRLAEVVNALPQSFTRSELDNIRETYSDFAERYATECDLTNPEELRDEASRIGNIGDSLKVDTDSAQDVLRESADEIENAQEQNQDWDSDDERRGGSSADSCSDAELDSMFGTLKD